MTNIEEMENKSKDFNFGINNCFGDFYKKIEKMQDKPKKHEPKKSKSKNDHSIEYISQFYNKKSK